MSLQIKVKKLFPDAVMPEYATQGDAAMDLFAFTHTEIKPGERVSVATGIAMEIPYGYVGLIWDKSGLSHKAGLKTLGGVIDAGYRGEIKIGMINLSTQIYVFEKGHKVAQMLIQERAEVELEETDMLSDSERGAGGFGSTGK